MDVSPSSSSAGNNGSPLIRPASSRRKADLSLLRIKSPKDYLNMFREWWHVGVVCGVLVGAVVGFKEIRKPPMFESKAALLFSTRTDRVINLTTVVDTNVSTQADLQTHIQQFNTKQFFDYVSNTLTKEEIDRIQRPYMVNNDPTTAPGVEGIVRGGISVTPRMGTTILDIQARHRDPDVAQLIASRYARKYIDYNLDNAEKSTDSAIQWLQTQVETQRVKLEKAEIAARAFKLKHNVTSLADNKNVATQRATSLSSALVSATIDKVNVQRLVDELDKIEKAGGDYLTAPFIAKLQEIATLVGTIESLKTSKLILDEDYGAKHPKVVANRTALDATRKQLDSALKTAVADVRQRYQLAKDQEIQLTKEVEAANKEALNMDKLQDEYRNLEREMNLASGFYAEALRSLNEKRITKQLESNSIKEMDQAYLNNLPYEPNPTASAFKAAFLACVIFLIIPVVIGTFDTRLKTAREIEDILAQTLLGEIPRVATKDVKARMRLIDNGEDDIATEAFRGLYGQLRLISRVKTPKIILVTSTVPAEGKSLVASNFAYTAASHGLRVLLVDGDFRRPTLNHHFAHKAGHGVLRFLTTPDARLESPLRDPLLAIESVRENLWFLPSGGASRKPTEFFESPKFKVLLDSLRANFDLVVIDTPPVGVFADALMLSPLCDEILYVARFKKVWRARVNNFVEKLTGSGTPIAGIVMNDLPPGLQSVGYDYYGYGTAVKEYQKYYAEKKD